MKLFKSWRQAIVLLIFTILTIIIIFSTLFKQGKIEDNEIVFEANNNAINQSTQRVRVKRTKDEEEIKSITDFTEESSSLSSEKNQEVTKSSQVVSEKSTNRASQENESVSIENNSYDDRPVHIVGEVNKPGIYKIGKKKYLYELVEEAGGLTKVADVEQLNLAMEIEALAHYKIYSKEEIENLSLDQKETVILPNAAKAFTTKTNSIETKDEEQVKDGNKKYDLNTVRLEELCNIPGIGEKTAKSIIEFRENNGENKMIVSDLLKIKGIKEKKYNKIKTFFIE